MTRSSRALPLAAWTTLVLALLAVAIGFVARRLRDAEEGAAPSPDAEAVEEPDAPPEESGVPIYGQAPEFRFVDEGGQPYGTAELLGKIWVVDFFFTSCPSICPAMTRNLRRVQDATADDSVVRLVSISVDPARDSIEALGNYARGHGADPEVWRFLRGEKEEVDRLSREGFVLPGGADLGGHSGRFVLVDAVGRIRGWYDGTRMDEVDRLVDDLERLAASPEGG